MLCLWTWIRSLVHFNSRTTMLKSIIYSNDIHKQIENKKVLNIKKWEVENSKLPRGRQRQAPQKPQILPSINNNDRNNSDLNRFNQVWEIKIKRTYFLNFGPYLFLSLNWVKMCSKNCLGHCRKLNYAGQAILLVTNSVNWLNNRGKLAKQWLDTLIA